MTRFQPVRPQCECGRLVRAVSVGAATEVVRRACPWCKARWQIVVTPIKRGVYLATLSRIQA